MNIKFILSTLMAGFCLMPCGATDITLLPDTTVMKNATATKSIELKTGNPTAITGKTGTLDIDWKKASVTPAAEGLQCTYEGNWKTYAITLSVNEQGYVASDFIRTETQPVLPISPMQETVCRRCGQKWFLQYSSPI